MPDLKKPRQWVFDPALVAPEWRWFWDDLEFCFPIWESSPSKLYDISSNHRDVEAVGSPSLTAAPLGQVSLLNATDQAWKYDSTDVPQGVAGQTMAVFANCTSGKNIRPFSVCDKDQQDNIKSIAILDRWVSWQWRKDAAVANATNYALISQAQGNSVQVSEGAHLWVVVSESASVHKGYVDGVLKTTNTTTVNSDSTYDRIGVGYYGDSSPAYGHGGSYWVAQWGRELSAGEIAQLARDPFGPFRMVDEAGVVYPVAAAATSWIEDWPA